MTTASKTACWQALVAHHAQIRNRTLAELFNADAQRVARFSLQLNGMHLDYSKNLVDGETMQLLAALARERRVGEQMLDMFEGRKINVSENRAVLHTALRSTVAASASQAAMLAEVQATQARMAKFCDAVRTGSLRAVGGERFTDIVSIGIGGSHLGPALAARALADYADAGLRVHFASNVDGAALYRTLHALDAATTLVVVVSKTFTTMETLVNARSARDWAARTLGDEKTAARHFAAVTANTRLALEFGIAEELVFPFWDWVGGRYSMWSAVGLPVALAIGMDLFSEMLAGAHAMDEHFRNAPFEQSMPVILALLGIWYNNFFGAETHAVIPYDDALALLPAYLQQLDMESSGKSVTAAGKPVDCDTGAIIWGAPGTDAQHSFFQLLHQGTRMVPCDFIAACNPQHELGSHHDILIANFLAQTAALMSGSAAAGAPGGFPGNRPSNSILLEKLTPRVLGQLIALYEHKVFVQNAVWGVNAFDQPGVELGKQLATRILPELAGPSAPAATLDASTRGLIGIYRQSRRSLQQGNPQVKEAQR